MPIGGGKFTLEKTWKSTAPSNTTFNTPSSVTIPYGRSAVYVSGRGGSGNSTTPGNVYYNPPSGGNAIYNPGSGGNVIYNPGSGGNYAGSNPGSGGNPAGTNPGSSTNFITAYISDFVYNTIYGNSLTNNTQYGTGNPCFSPYSVFNVYYSPGDGSVTYSYLVVEYSCQVTYAPGNVIYNPYYPGNAIYNPYTPGNFVGYNPYYPGNFTGSYNPYVPGNYAGVNPTTPGNPGTPTNVLGVSFPGGSVGSLGAYVPPTQVSYYSYPDNATYPVTVPTGSYINIEIQ